MEASSCVVIGKKMYIVVVMQHSHQQLKDFMFTKKQVDIGTKLNCELEPESSLCKKAITVKTKEGDKVGHVPDLLVHVLAPEISGGNEQG